MAEVEKRIEVEAPLTAVYNQWTQFEEFPRFMEGVKSVTQLGDDRLHWVAEIAGKEKEWDARITEQTPDERVAWCSEDGAENAGVVTFHRISDDKTKVMMQMDYDPDGVVEGTGNMLGFVGRQLDGDLKRLKDFIEERGRATGGWRGTIDRKAS
jgi:uncharacterized membrane protein